MRSELRLTDLSPVDIDELKDELREAGIAEEELMIEDAQPVDPDRAEDFGVTAAIVVVSLSAISAVSLWLSKKNSRQGIHQTVERFENGALVERRVIYLELNTSEAPDPKIAHEIASVAGELGKLVK